MSAHVVGVTSGGGLPIFSRKKGNTENLPFSIIGSLNGVHMFAKSQKIKIQESYTQDHTVVWKEYHDSLVLIGIASGCTAEVITLTLNAIFDAVVLIVGIDEVKSQRNIERLKRELRICYPIIDRLLDSLDCGDSNSKHCSDLVGMAETILCPENQLIQGVLETFAESVDSMFNCVLIHGKIAVASSSWWSLHPEEIKLLSLLAVNENTTSSKDIPVFLPYKSPNVAFRFVCCSLIPEIQLCCLCGSTPILSEIEHLATNAFKNSADILGSAIQSHPRNFPLTCHIDGGILGFLLVNTLCRKYIITRNPQQNTAKKNANSSHRLDILRTFFYQSVLPFLIPNLESQENAGGNQLHNGLETYWCSEYHKCYALKMHDNILAVLFNSSIPTFTMRTIAEKTLKNLIADKQNCW